MPLNNKPMNEQSAFSETTVATPTTDFQIGFQFVEGVHNLNITLDDAPLPIEYDATIISDTTVRIEPAIAAGKVRLMRETDIDDNLHKFSSGALFEAKEMDENFEQIRFSQQEVKDAADKVAERVIPLADGLEEALETANEASQAAQEAADAAQVAAAQTKYYLRYYEAPTIYPRFARIMLNDGSVVVSKINDNTSNPNVDMTNWVRQSALYSPATADPRDFGAPNNGVDDDAAGIRSAVDYLKTKGGGTLRLASDTAWQLNTLHSNGLDAILLGQSNIVVDLGNSHTEMHANIAMRGMIKLSDEYQNRIEIIGGILRGNNLAQYGIYGDPSTFNPFMYIRGFEARSCTVASASMNPYMTTILNSNFSFSPKGLILNNKGTVAEITSTTIIGCYANGCSTKGFEANNRTMYANMISCGVDDCGGIAYDLALQSANILGCGAERSVTLARFNINDGVSIQGLLGVGIGSLDSMSPSSAAVEVVGSGFDAIRFSGVRILNHPTQSRYRSKDLRVVSSSGVYPKVVVLDRSFLKANTEILGTSVYGYPVEFRENYIRNNDTVTIAPSALKDTLYLVSDSTNEFTYTIQLQNGTETLDKLLSNLKGNGTIIIQGNAADRTLTRLKGSRLGFNVSNCSCRIVLKNLTIENQYTVSDNSITQLDIDNCRNVVLDNVLFDSPTYGVGSAVRARNGSHITIMNGTTCGLNHTSGNAYEFQTGSTVHMQAVTTAPTGRWTYGMRVNNSNPVSNGIIEWVYVRNTTTSTNEWKAIT